MKIKIKNIKVRGNRIWLPKKIQKKINDNFIDVEIIKSMGRSNFLTIITKDGRFVLPKHIREGLRLKYNDNVNLCIKIVCNKKRRKCFFRKNKFDMTAFVPKRTMSNFKVLAKEEDSWILMWYSTKGRPNEIKIRRFLPLEFAKLLGYYQAEGGKPKLHERRGREFSFTNKSPKFILDFISLSKHLFKPCLWNVTIRYNPNINKSEIRKISYFLKENGIEPNNIRAKGASRISRYTVKLWISNTLLAETVFKMTESVMKYLLKSQWRKRETDICIYFLQGLIAGDGSFYSWKDKKGSFHPRIKIFEGNKEYADIYERLLSKFGITGKVRKDKDKNLSIFTSYTNWDNLLTILKYDIFKHPDHERRLRNSILSHKRYRALRYLPYINSKISARLLGKITKKSNYYNSSWLRDRANEGIVKRIENNRKSICLWELTKKGKEIKRIIRKL